MAIVLQESLRGLFYAPYYAALSRGAYEAEGVEVRFVSAATPDSGPNALFDGTVDVSWGGPMRVNQLYAERADCDLVCFGEAVTRDPFLLVGRQPNPNFSPADLMKVRLGTVSEVPTPFLAPAGGPPPGPGSIPRRLTGSRAIRWRRTWPRCAAARSMSCSCSSLSPRNC